jgi:protochlorophyllide reductase
MIEARKTVVITGANRGVGYAAAKQLALTGEWRVVMACRDTAKGEMARLSFGEVGRSNCEVRELDLADLNSVKSFVRKWGKERIDVLANNAGIQTSTSGFGGTENLPPQRTAQGFEKTVGTNHIGHFLLTKLMLDKINERVVWVGSGVHNPDEAGGNVGSKATLGDLKGLKQGFVEPISMVDGGGYDPDKAYKDSKLCNVATSLELARRLIASKSKVTSNVMNPGLIPTTGLFRDINPLFVVVFSFLTKYVFRVAVSEEVGGDRLAFMISIPSLASVTGAYYSGNPITSFVPKSPSKEAVEVGRVLWESTEKLISKF